jgi:hypothetical protein
MRLAADGSCVEIAKSPDGSPGWIMYFDHEDPEEVVWRPCRECPMCRTDLRPPTRREAGRMAGMSDDVARVRAAAALAAAGPWSVRREDNGYGHERCDVARPASHGGLQTFCEPWLHSPTRLNDAAFIAAALNAALPLCDEVDSLRAIRTAALALSRAIEPADLPPVGRMALLALRVALGPESLPDD